MVVAVDDSDVTAVDEKVEVPVVVTVVEPLADAVEDSVDDCVDVSVVETDVDAVDDNVEEAVVVTVDVTVEMTDEVGVVVAVEVSDDTWVEVAVDVTLDVPDVDTVVDGVVTSQSTCRLASDSRRAMLSTADASLHDTNDSAVYNTCTNGRQVKTCAEFRFAPVNRAISTETELIALAAALHAEALVSLKKKLESCEKQPREKLVPTWQLAKRRFSFATESVQLALLRLVNKFSPPLTLVSQVKKVSGPRTSSLTTSMETAMGPTLEDKLLPSRSVIGVERRLRTEVEPPIVKKH